MGIAFALSAGICWGAYILLTQAIGQRFHGITGLAVSMPVAALATTPLGLAQAHGHITPTVLVACLGLALILPVIPYTLELLALRRLDAGTFGTLMSVEPAAAALVGALMLRQIPGWGQAVGISLVTIAAIGAARTGRASEPSWRLGPRPAESPRARDRFSAAGERGKATAPGEGGERGTQAVPRTGGLRGFGRSGGSRTPAARESPGKIGPTTIKEVT